MNFPKSITVTLQSEISNNFLCKLACDSLDIDINKKSIHTLTIDHIEIPDDWSIGVIYGASGSGKTSLAHKLFGIDCFKSNIDKEQPLMNQFPEDYKYDDIAKILNGIGLNSVPCWVRPVKTLSNGQLARAEAALAMISSDQPVLIDEWTSVVDRTVGKAMSNCVHKFAKRNKKQIILLTCHIDIIEWVKPDWLIDCNKQEFVLPESDAFFLLRGNHSSSLSDKLGRKHGSILANITI